MRVRSTKNSGYTRLSVQNMPAASSPQAPAAPWTADASRGSSMRKRRRRLRVPKYTSAPTPAMMQTAHCSAKSTLALMLTRPARRLLRTVWSSKRPSQKREMRMPAKPPAERATVVLTATTATTAPLFCRCPTHPQLKPYQPNARTPVPSTISVLLCPSSSLGLPVSGSNLPMRGLRKMAPVSAATPPTMCTTPDPAKSRTPLLPKIASLGPSGF
mmetsp:Transcript_17183/g.43430  ORF Transcript_17183/g.43430 Transcript_17183/m.43430 type:complete len:215 (-) Transcript_17183:539-1183(-)